MDYLTLDELIVKLSEMRTNIGHGNVAVFADVGMGEYEVSFQGVKYLEDRRAVMLYDSPWSEYAPGIAETT